MRHMVETHPRELLELTDGVRVFRANDPESWILVLPDAGEPLVHLYANSAERDWTDTILREYRNRVQQFVEQEQEQPDAFNYEVEVVS